jgi:hypothetical protein
MPIHRIYLAAAALASLAGSVGLTAESSGVTEYQATYEVQYKGRRVAAAEFSVAANAASEFTFYSSTRARGLLRLAAPNPATEQSRFMIENGRLKPVDFNYADGSRKGEDNYAVEFDQAAREIRVTSESGPQILPLEHDLLDRGTLQVALMRDLTACKPPDAYRYVDDDGINLSRYERLDDQPAETGIGTLPTQRYSQQREGSSRKTVLWMAPELAYLPVRIEQFRNGELETVFSLDSVAGIERQASTCSGLR